MHSCASSHPTTLHIWSPSVWGIFPHIKQFSMTPAVCVCVCARAWAHMLSCSAEPDSLCSPLGSSVLGVFQVRTLEWIAIIFSRGSSQPRNWTCISCIAGRFSTTGKPSGKPKGNKNKVWETECSLAVSGLKKVSCLHSRRSFIYKLQNTNHKIPRVIIY